MNSSSPEVVELTRKAGCRLSTRSSRWKQHACGPSRGFHTVFKRWGRQGGAGSTEDGWGSGESELGRGRRWGARETQRALQPLAVNRKSRPPRARLRKRESRRGEAATGFELQSKENTPDGTTISPPAQRASSQAGLPSSPSLIAHCA